ILGQGVRELYVSVLSASRLSAVMTGRWHPKRENGVSAFWLRFEGIGIEGGGVITNVQVMQPLQVVKHETRPESARAPFVKIMIDVSRVPAKGAPGSEQASVVSEIMDTDFKTIPDKLFAKFFGNAVCPFRHEIE